MKDYKFLNTETMCAKIMERYLITQEELSNNVHSLLLQFFEKPEPIHFRFGLLLFVKEKETRKYVMSLVNKEDMYA